jgi:hypothetical protein
MSAKQLLRIALVLLGALALWGMLAVAHRSRRDSTQRMVMPAVDKSAVDRIEFRKGGDSVVLIKSDAGWTVNGWPADPEAAKQFLTALGDTTAQVELAAQSTGSHQRLGVDSASARSVQLIENGKPLLRLMVGNHGPDYDGYYVRLADASEVYLTHAGWAELATRVVDDWRDKQIAKITKDSIGAIEITRGKTSYTIKRDGGWTLSPPGSADSAAVDRLAGAFGELRAVSFATQSQVDSLRFFKPARTVRVTGKNGAPLLSLAFDSTSAGFLVHGDSSRIVYRVDTFLADQVAPAESTLVAKPKK